ncbi:iron transporter [Roseomonas eburnea]|uniref:Iron transporter n=2 Tax=Neoroseomonas eburnea TaxID=1346889 RepID=A0A9X9X8G4_9PROT|nr:iron transporter [Neoroseomonas eburnea]
MPPGPPHEESHFAQAAVVRDFVIGAADGLVLPFALATGLVAAGLAHPLIVVAGLAVIAAGCVAMGLGGYLAARSEADRYASERKREEHETVEYADRERWEVAAILHRYGVRGDALRMAVDSVCAEKRRWVDFMMRFELDLKEPEPQRAGRSAVATGSGHAAGGLIPIAPYMLMPEAGGALAVSSALTAGALVAFGWMKARATGLPPLRGAAQTLAVGAVAATVAAILARAAGG